jgi:hypothetical protein
MALLVEEILHTAVHTVNRDVVEWGQKPSAIVGGMKDIIV